MQCFRLTHGLFRTIIAAPSREAAKYFARATMGRDGPIVEWLTPDVWTRRACDAATEPSIIDRVPRFVVDRGGERELDLDDIPAKLEPGEADKLRHDSLDHAAWLGAFQAVHEGGEALRKCVVGVATMIDPGLHAMTARALAAAYGLGPVPEWHAAILPALIALDVQLEHEGRSVGPDALELPIERLADRMSYVLDLRPSYTARRVAVRLRDALDAHPDTSLRDASTWALGQLQALRAA